MMADHGSIFQTRCGEEGSQTGLADARRIPVFTANHRGGFRIPEQGRSEIACIDTGILAGKHAGNLSGKVARFARLYDSPLAVYHGIAALKSSWSAFCDDYDDGSYHPRDTN